MNILHLDEQRGWRGGEQQASWLVRGQVQRGHNVILAGRHESQFLDHFVQDRSIPQYRFPFRSEIAIGSAALLAKIVRQYQVDIIHAHTSHAHMIGCLARGIARRGRVIVSRRVGFPPRQDPVNRLKYRLPDHYIAVSQRVAEVLLENGIPREKVTRVHSSVDLQRLEVPPADRASLGVPEGVPLLFSAGALVPHKDHDNLLKAFALILPDYPDARLLIAGEGSLRPELEAKIVQLNLQQRVQLLGHQKEVPALVRAADLYVSSSWSEGLGTSVLEALAASTPTVATEAGGVGEMVLDGETGLLVPNRAPTQLAGAILRALKEPEHAREMALRGRQHVEENFTVDRMVEGNLQVYERVLAAARR